MKNYGLEIQDFLLSYLCNFQLIDNKKRNDNVCSIETQTANFDPLYRSGNRAILKSVSTLNAILKVLTRLSNQQ